MKPKQDALDYINELARSDAAYPGAAAAYDLVQQVARGLRKMRKRHGLSQKAVAERLGVSQGRISQIESGLVDYAPSLEMVAKFAKACGETSVLSFAKSGDDDRAADTAQVNEDSRSQEQGEFDRLIDAHSRSRGARVIGFDDRQPMTPTDRFLLDFVEALTHMHPGEAEVIPERDELRLSGKLAREVMQVMIGEDTSRRHGRSN